MADQQYVVNHAIGKYDAITVDKASKVADDTFHMIHDTLEKQVHRPLVIIAGDECQQPPLQTVNGRTIQTTLILKNRRLHEVCQIQSLYQQFWCTDAAYLDFLQHIRHSKPEQYVLDNFQHPLLSFNQSDLTDYDIWKTIEEAPDATFLTVSRAAATRVNSIIIRQMFQEKTPMSSIPLENDVEEFLPFKHVRVVVTQNLNKGTGVVNGQLANTANNENNTLLLQFLNGKTTFTYPVTTTSEDGLSRVHYALNPAYSMTICKTQGANIKKLIVWFDCPTVPKGMGYMALSRVQKSENIKILSPMVTDQLTPALSWTLLTTGNLSSWKYTAYSSQDTSRCYKTLSQTRSARLHNLPYSSDMTKHFTPLACLLLARTRCQIAAEQRYTYPLKQHSSPPNAQSHQQ